MFDAKYIKKLKLQYENYRLCFKYMK